MNAPVKISRVLFPPTPAEPIVEHALHYARAGWSVFPLRLGEKISHKSAAHSDGRKWGQTTDVNEIRRDFKQWPNANVGIVTGAVSGIFVVETDTADGHAEGTDGAAELTKLEAEHGALPATREAESPSGSIHRYYNHPGFKIKTSASEIGPGIDVRGDGGMVVAPPSVKPGKGAYKWRNDLAIADAPQWLLDKIVAGKEKPEAAPELTTTQQALATVRPPSGYVDHYAEYGAESHRGNGSGYIEATLNGAHDDVVGAPKGKRNEQLNDSSMWLGHFVGGGVLDERKVIDTLMDACATSGLLADDGKHQCLATIRSGLEAGKRDPRGIPERKSADVIQHPSAKTQDEPEVAPRPLQWLDMSDWDHQPVPEREWIIQDRVPIRQVGLFSGEGGTGKSIIELMRNVAHVTGKDWLGSMPEPGPALYLGAEDEATEIHIRLAAIAKHYGVTFKDLIEGGLHVLPLLGKDATLCAPTKSGKIEVTGLYKQLYEAAGDIKPKNISIDTLSRAFAGNEIDRVQVYAFAMHMQAIAEVAGGSVTILSHPSLAGINSGSGISGSTAWHGAFRFRFYLKSTKTEGGEQPDNDLREIEFKKNQYGPKSESIVLRYQHGLFLPEAGLSGLDKVARRARAEEVFMDLLRRFAGQGRNVSDKQNANQYAPKVFATEDEAKKYQIKKLELEQAMRDLFRADRIMLEQYDKPSRGLWRIAVKGDRP